MKRITPKARTRACKLRANMTDAEHCLWRCLRNRQLHGFKFRRQVVLGTYIVDFLCIETKLIIEIDGKQHLYQCDYDKQRSLWMNRCGYQVLRFWNNEVLEDLDGVLEEISVYLLDGPSPQRGEGGQ